MYLMETHQYAPTGEDQGLNYLRLPPCMPHSFLCALKACLVSLFDLSCCKLNAMDFNRGAFRTALAVLCVVGLLFLLQNYRRLDLASVASMGAFSHNPELQKLDLDYPDNFGPLTELCEQIKWIPDRVWQCEHAKGGLSNVYNMVLACVRLAIEAGATALVLPTIWIRSTSEPIVLISGNSSDITDLSYLFDVPHFRSSLERGCPQMIVYSSKKDIPHLADDPRYCGLWSPDLGGLQVWRKSLDGWLASKVEDAGGSHTHQVCDYILLDRTLFKWRVWDDGVEFGNNFKSILHFRQDARRIALALLKEMRRIFTTDDGTFRYLGVHLRTGADLGPEWDSMGFEVQYDSYLKQASSANIPLIYLGSGVSQDEKLFTERAWNEYGINVTTKHKLLSPSDLKILDSMSSDQQASVDFEILSRADRFGGMHRSSFAWQIAFRMHTRSELSIEDSLHKQPDIWHDEFSNIVNTEPVTSFDFFWWGTWP